MKKLFFVLLLASMLLAACGPAATPEPTQTPLPPTDTATITETPTTAPTDTPTLTPTPAYPPEGYGPSNFPADVDPLTGLKVANPALLERRPMLIKVANLPRYVRPQWGVSLADIVFEYYTEEGTTRFAAIYLGNDAATVGPIRSGRFIDWHLVKGYKAVFALGSAYVAEMDRFLSSDFANRLVVEGPSTPMKRFDPNGYDFLTVGTSELSAHITQKGVENGRQDLNGMFFQLQPPADGQPALQLVAHYSGSIYNRWDYDAATGKYLRFSDNADVFSAGEAEKYVQLTDRLTNQPIAFDNVVVVYAQHPLYSPGIYDINLSGTGKGFAFRDGQMFPVTWTRSTNSVVTLANADGTPYALKPGTTWFEVMGFNTNSEQTAQGWRFTHLMP